uniref:Uncharacterized protein n=1 Tax=Cacopsylla melanoneura TaxID=428564 RepID=A0A8D8VKK0_9HEMI
MPTIPLTFSSHSPCVRVICFVLLQYQVLKSLTTRSTTARTTVVSLPRTGLPLPLSTRTFRPRTVTCPHRANETTASSTRRRWRQRVTATVVRTRQASRKTMEERWSILDT